jgi:hypothetical protein
VQHKIAVLRQNMMTFPSSSLHRRRLNAVDTARTFILCGACEKIGPVSVLHTRYLAAALLLAGCGSGNREPAIGEGFVAPATLNLRQELGPRQPSMATVRHGERLEILERRRRFVRVRAGSGAIGWIDGDLLFGPEQMETLRALGRWAATLPSQGQATVLDTLNVHTDSNRESPSFQQFREGEHAAVVAHRLVTSAARTEDWSLVRLSGGEAGWVLTRALFMSIPDEVAQYAEGHRIMSYFALGEVKDGDRVKQNWLWTTLSKGGQPYEFDAVRVFVWSRTRSRYETAFVDRKVKGYYPVEVVQKLGASPSFSIIVDEKDGTRVRRTYAFQGYHVRLESKTPWTQPLQTSPPPASALAAKGKQASKSLFGRWGESLADLRRKIFGR